MTSDPSPARISMQLIQRPRVGEDTRRLHAYVVLRASEWAGDAAGPRAEILLLDHSTSMGTPPSKLMLAREAACTAVEMLEDGTRFAVVLGDHEARALYPTAGLEVADPRTRDEALRAIRAVDTGGGTAISRWLHLAHETFATAEAAIRHALLLTDGKNEHDEEPELARALQDTAGSFVCDSLGFGDDYDPECVLRIADRSGGHAEAAVAEDDLPERFRGLMARAQRTVRQDVVLRVAPTQLARLVGVRQAIPRQVDETPRLRRSEDEVELSTGSWAPGERKAYFLTFEVEPHGDIQLETPLMIAEIDLVPVPGLETPPTDAVVGHWTFGDRSDEPEEPEAEEWGCRAEMSTAVDEGYRAWGAGDRRLAAERWSRARRLAEELDDRRMLEEISWLLEEAPGEGGPAVRRDLSASKVFKALIDSRTNPGAEPEPGPEPEEHRPPMQCPACGRRHERPRNFCEECRHPLDTGDTP